MGTDATNLRYMWLAGLNGTCQKPPYLGWTLVNSISITEPAGSHALGGGNRSLGATTMSSLLVVKEMDNNSGILQAWACRGQPIPAAKLAITDAKGHLLLRVELQKLTPESTEFYGIRETLHFSFIGWKAVVGAATGASQPASRMVWGNGR